MSDQNLPNDSSAKQFVTICNEPARSRDRLQRRGAEDYVGIAWSALSNDDDEAENCHSACGSWRSGLCTRDPFGFFEREGLELA